MSLKDLNVSRLNKNNKGREERETRLNRWRDCATWTPRLPTDALALWTKEEENARRWITGLSLSFISLESGEWREDSWRRCWIAFFNPNPEKARGSLQATNVYKEKLRLPDLNVFGRLLGKQSEAFFFFSHLLWFILCLHLLFGPQIPPLVRLTCSNPTVISVKQHYNITTTWVTWERKR